MGPFVDSDNNMVRCGVMDETFDEVFEDAVVAKVRPGCNRERCRGLAILGSLTGFWSYRGCPPRFWTSARPITAPPASR